MLIRISSEHFVAGFEHGSGELPPIIRYMKDWNLAKIVKYCKKKGWKVEIKDGDWTHYDEPD